MARNKTYTIYLRSEGRWAMDLVLDTKERAIEKAQTLLASKRYEAVKVVEESSFGWESTVFEEELAVPAEKPITLIPVKEVPFCRTVEDLYGREARMAVGRMLRRHLDKQGFTPLELMHNRFHLKAFRRNETLLYQAINAAAALQAEAAGVKPRERAQAIETMVEEVFARAGTASDFEAGLNGLRDDGPSGLDGAASDDPQAAFAARSTLAHYLGQSGDWSGKVDLLAGLAARRPGPAALALLDEALAEILDSAEAIRELLGGLPDLASAIVVLIELARGRRTPRGGEPTAVDRINALLADNPGFVHAPAVLLDRVQRELASVRHLTRVGLQRDQQAFMAILERLFEAAGLAGGPEVASAIAQRARIVLMNGEDGTVERGIAKVIECLPSKAKRIGFVLDLSASSMGRNQSEIVLHALGGLLERLRDLTDLVTSERGSTDREETVADLRRRLPGAAVPDDWKARITALLDGFLAGKVRQVPAESADAPAPGRPSEAEAGKGAPEVIRAPRGVSHFTKPTSSGPFTGLRMNEVVTVLGIENPDVGRALREGLTGCGFSDVVQAKHLSAVRESLDAGEVDLVICDIDLTGGDFCELSRHVRHHEFGRNPFVILIAVSAEPKPDVVRKVINSGADDLLVAPISVAAALTRVRALITARKPFIVTHDYIGPDRRDKGRAEASPIPVTEVPNTLGLKARGEFDQAVVQRMIDKVTSHLNERKVERYAIQIVYLARKLVPALRAGDRGEQVDGHVKRLMFVAEDISRRMVDTQYAHAGELCQAVAGVAGRLDVENPTGRDVSLLEQLSVAVEQAFRATGRDAEVARDISRAVGEAAAKPRPKPPA